MGTFAASGRAMKRRKVWKKRGQMRLQSQDQSQDKSQDKSQDQSHDESYFSTHAVVNQRYFGIGVFCRFRRVRLRLGCFGSSYLFPPCLAFVLGGFGGFGVLAW